MATLSDSQGLPEDFLNEWVNVTAFHWGQSPFGLIANITRMHDENVPVPAHTQDPPVDLDPLPGRPDRYFCEQQYDSFALEQTMRVPGSALVANPLSKSESSKEDSPDILENESSFDHDEFDAWLSTFDAGAVQTTDPHNFAHHQFPLESAQQPHSATGNKQISFNTCGNVPPESLMTQLDNPGMSTIDASLKFLPSSGFLDIYCGRSEASAPVVPY